MRHVSKIDPTVIARPVQVTAQSEPEQHEKKKSKKKQAKKSKLKKQKNDSRGKKKNGNSGKGKVKKEKVNSARKRKASEANLTSPPSQKVRHLTRKTRTQIKGWEEKFVKALAKYKKDGLKQAVRLDYFWAPVHEINHSAPNYHKVILNPMDFMTIEEKLKAENYTSFGECVKDCELVFFNARMYNKPGHFVYAASQDAQKLFTDKKSSGFGKLVEEYGSENDKKAWRSKHRLGDFGPFCYDPDYDHDNPLFK